MISNLLNSVKEKFSSLTPPKSTKAELAAHTAAQHIVRASELLDSFRNCGLDQITAVMEDADALRQQIDCYGPAHSYASKLITAARSHEGLLNCTAWIKRFQACIRNEDTATRAQFGLDANHREVFNMFTVRHEIRDEPLNVACVADFEAAWENACALPLTSQEQGFFQKVEGMVKGWYREDNPGDEPIVAEKTSRLQAENTPTQTGAQAATSPGPGSGSGSGDVTIAAEPRSRLEAESPGTRPTAQKAALAKPTTKPAPALLPDIERNIPVEETVAAVRDLIRQGALSCDSLVGIFEDRRFSLQQIDLALPGIQDSLQTDEAAFVEQTRQRMLQQSGMSKETEDIVLSLYPTQYTEALDKLNPAIASTRQVNQLLLPFLREEKNVDPFTTLEKIAIVGENVGAVVIPAAILKDSMAAFMTFRSLNPQRVLSREAEQGFKTLQKWTYPQQAN